MKKLKCNCPIYCRFCGAKRRWDWMGHYCPTKNCQWHHGYSTCEAGEQKQDKLAGQLQDAQERITDLESQLAECERQRDALAAIKACRYEADNADWSRTGLPEAISLSDWCVTHDQSVWRCLAALTEAGEGEK